MARTLVWTATELVRDSLAAWLRQAGHDVEVAASADEAARRLAHRPPDVLLLAEPLPAGKLPSLLALRQCYAAMRIVFIDEGALRPERPGDLGAWYARVCGVDAVIAWPFGRAAAIGAFDAAIGPAPAADMRSPREIAATAA